MNGTTSFAPADAKSTYSSIAGGSFAPGRWRAIGIGAAIFFGGMGVALAQWQSADIGTATAGSTDDANGTITITGSGRDIWNEADGFRFYYQPFSGDGEIVVRVASLQDANGWSKAAIMFRESLDPGSAQVMVCVSAEHGTAMQWRNGTGAGSNTTAPSEDGTAPRWLKLVRATKPASASQIGAFVSNDGLTWTPAGYGPFNIYPRYVGLAVTSHNDGALCTAQFDHVQLILPPLPATGLHVSHRGPDGEIDLAWTNQATDADHVEVQRQDAYADAQFGGQGTLPPATNQFAAHIGSGSAATFLLATYHDLVASYSSEIQAVGTISPALMPQGSTTSSIDLKWEESNVSISGPQGGPWSLERSSDGVSFTPIAGGFYSNAGFDTYYTDGGLPSATSYYYRVRQLFPNGDSGAYSNILLTSTDGPPPAAPSALTATATSTTSVQLTWADNSSDETSFAIWRSTDGASFSFLHTASANTMQYTDSSVAPSTTYYYKVRAMLNQTASADSNIASVTTGGGTATGSGWQSQDIGNPAAHGTTSSSGSSVTVSGSGADIWNNADAFQFAYQSLSGDGMIVARVASMSDTNGWAKAGVMIRETLDANARNVFAAVTPEQHGVVAQARATAGDATAQLAGAAAGHAPYWVRLSRAGSSFHASQSADGIDWKDFATFDVSMASNVYVGLAVTSHADGVVCTTTFDNLTNTFAASGSSAPPAGGPTLTSVSASSHIGLRSGAALDLRATFTDNVTVTGTPSIGVVIGTATKQATYVSGSGSSTLWFSYTVTSSDLDTDGVTINSPINLNGGTIKDGSGVDAATSFTPPNPTTVYLYGTPPPAPHVTGVSTHAGPGSVSADGSSATVALKLMLVNDLTLSGTAVPYSKVYLEFDNPQALSDGIIDADANGHWSVQLAGSAFSLQPGATVSVYYYTVDLAGQVSPAGSTAVTMIATPGAPTVSSVTVTGQVGTPVSPVQIPTTNSPTRFDAGTLDGLTISSGGVISGTPTAAANKPVTVFAGNDAGFNVGTITLNISPASSGTTGSWQSRDIGTPAVQGSTSNSGSTMTVTGSGVDIWGTADACQFACQTMSGDGTITARILSMTEPNGWAKAGVMIRQSLDANSPNVFVGITPTQHGVFGQWRRTVTDGTSQVAGPFVHPAYWLRLTRMGSAFSCATSLDGVTWSEFQSLTSIPMNQQVYVGLAVTSHNDGALCSATFDNITVTAPATATTIPAAPTALTATLTAPQQIRLSWQNNATNDSGFEVQRSTNQENYTVVFHGGGAGVASYNDYGSASTTYYYRVLVFNSAGSSGFSNLATVTTQPDSSDFILQKIGDVSMAPRGSWQNGTESVSAEGLDIWGGADSFALAYRTLTGDGAITARITSIGNSDGWAKAGVMLRDTLAADARNIFVGATSAHGIVAQVRSAQGDATTQTAGPATTPPQWLRISRTGNVFTAAISGDGLAWTTLTTANITMGSTLYAGFAVSSHNSATLCPATFDNFSFSTSTSNSPGVSDVTIIGQVGAAIAPVQVNATNGPNTFAAPELVNYGLAISSSGVITGTPTVAGNGVHITVTATNGAHATGSGIITLNIAAADNSNPSLWQSTDIGTTNAGSTVASGSTITVRGSGADVWDAADGCRFVSETRTGDGVVEAQVTSMENTNGWAKAGVMIRETTAAGARNVFVAVTPAHGIIAQTRLATGGSTTQNAGPARNAPYWVRLARSGNTFTASTSPDGTTWTTFGTFSVAMSSTANFGFAVCAHDNTQLNQVVFTDPFIGGP